MMTMPTADAQQTMTEDQVNNARQAVRDHFGNISTKADKLARRIAVILGDLPNMSKPEQAVMGGTLARIMAELTVLMAELEAMKEHPDNTGASLYYYGTSINL